MFTNEIPEWLEQSKAERVVDQLVRIAEKLETNLYTLYDAYLVIVSGTKVHVRRTNNEDSGMIMLHARTYPDGLEVMQFEEGPWVDYVLGL